MPAEPFVVRGDTFPDALSVAPFAYAQVRPVLLVSPGTAPPASVAALEDLGADTVYVVGSEAAVGRDALIDLAAGTPEGTIHVARVWGTDRYKTASALVQAWEMPFDRLGIATGLDFPDALAGGIALGEHRGGLLLARPGELDADAVDVIRENGTYLWPIQLFGGTAALRDEVMSVAAAAAGNSVYELEEAGGRRAAGPRRSPAEAGRVRQGTRSSGCRSSRFPRHRRRGSRLPAGPHPLHSSPTTDTSRRVPARAGE